MNVFRFRFWILGLLTMAWIVPVLSSPQPHLSVEELTSKATYVVSGRVSEVKSLWNDGHTNIYSYVTVNISESFKTNFPGGELKLRVWGGAIPEEDIGAYSPELPFFVEDTEVMLFVRRDYKSVYPLVGNANGIFVLDVDEDSGESVAVSQSGMVMDRAEFDSRVRASAGSKEP